MNGQKYPENYNLFILTRIMVHRKLILVFDWLVGLTPVSKGQQVETPDNSKRSHLYKKERSFIAAIQTNGYYFGYSLGKIDKYYLTKYSTLTLDTWRTNRESKINRLTAPMVCWAIIYMPSRMICGTCAQVGGFALLLRKNASRKGVAVGLRLRRWSATWVLQNLTICKSEIRSTIITRSMKSILSDNADVFW